MCEISAVIVNGDLFKDCFYAMTLDPAQKELECHTIQEMCWRQHIPPHHLLSLTLDTSWKANDMDNEVC